MSYRPTKFARSEQTPSTSAEESPSQQHEQEEEHREHRERRDERVLAPLDGPFVFVFALRATELLAHRDRSRTDSAVPMFDDDWRGFLLVLRHFGSTFACCFSTRIYSLV